jgi:hypothetical protein
MPTQPLVNRRRLSLYACALAVLVSFAAQPAIAPAQDKPKTKQNAGDTLEALLKQGKMFYQRIDEPGKPPAFKLVIQDSKGRSSIIMLRLAAFGWTYNDGTPSDFVYGFTQVLPATPDHPVSAAVARKVSELNDSFVIASGSINPSGVFANVSFYLRGLDSESLDGYTATLHGVAQGMKEALAPVVAAEAAEK